jgi:hypothetical protein
VKAGYPVKQQTQQSLIGEKTMSAITNFVQPAELLFQPIEKKGAFREPRAKTDSAQLDR